MQTILISILTAAITTKIIATYYFKKIDGYVEKQLGERPEMLASELPLDTTDDFVKMIYVRLYGQRKNMKYVVSVRETIQKEGYQFTDFTIRKKVQK